MDGTEIKKALSARGRTIKWLSDESGVPLNTLYAITKRNSTKVHFETWQKIMNVLGDDLRALRENSDKPADTKPQNILMQFAIIVKITETDGHKMVSVRSVDL